MFSSYVTHRSIILVVKFPQNMALILKNTKRSRSPTQSHRLVCVFSGMHSTFPIQPVSYPSSLLFSPNFFQIFSPRDCQNPWVRGWLCAIACKQTHVKDSWSTTFHLAKSLTCNQDTMGIVCLCAVWGLYQRDYAFPSRTGQEAVTMANKFRAPINETERAEPRKGREDMVNVYIGIVCIPRWCTSTHASVSTGEHNMQPWTSCSWKQCFKLFEDGDAFCCSWLDTLCCTWILIHYYVHDGFFLYKNSTILYFFCK